MDGDDDDCYYDDDVEEMGMEVEDDDESAFMDGIEEAAPQPENRTVSWVITKETLFAAQKEELSTVMNLLAVKEHHARALLMHHRWKLQSIYDRLDQNGRDRLLLEAGVLLQEGRSRLVPLGSVTCNVCFSDVSLGEASAMDCGHYFCNDCWTGHFVARISSGDKQIRCMEVKCRAICDEDIVRHLVSKSHPEMAERFEHFLLKSYLEDNDTVKWCPSTPHCGNALRVKGEKYCEVECPCGVAFCFNCLGEVHSPCPCGMWSLWAKKCGNESENVNWILVNTKCCPKCYKPIEKNGGCNHVMCKCGQSLCWLCGAATGLAHDWNRINGHSCNRFTEEDKKKIDNAKRQLDRYTHYYKRYKAHDNSYKAEKKLDLDARIKLLEERFENPLVTDSSWILKAHKRLLGSRKMLFCSYVFAFYMFGEDLQTYKLEQKYKLAKQNLFEDQQEQLEGNVERLSKLVAEDVTVLPEKKVLDVKIQAISLAKIVGNCCMEMHKCIQDELLPLLKDTMHIAPYQPDGLDRAKELQTC